MSALASREIFGYAVGGTQIVVSMGRSRLPQPAGHGYVNEPGLMRRSSRELCLRVCNQSRYFSARNLTVGAPQNSISHVVNSTNRHLLLLQWTDTSFLVTSQETRIPFFITVSQNKRAGRPIRAQQRAVLALLDMYY